MKKKREEILQEWKKIRWPKGREVAKRLLLVVVSAAVIACLTGLVDAAAQFMLSLAI